MRRHYIKSSRRESDYKTETWAYDYMKTMNVPHVLPLLGRDPMRMQLMLPFVGKDLYYMFKSVEPIDTIQMLGIMVAVCDFLRTIHYYNLIHGDIKCENIMFNKEDNQTYVIDFDFVRKVNGSAGVQIRRGTLELFGLEHYQGYMYKSTDVWSFAIMLSECVFGNCQFEIKRFDFIKNIWDINEFYRFERSNRKMISIFRHLCYVKPTSRPARYMDMSLETFAAIQELMAKMLEIDQSKRPTSQYVWETLKQLHENEIINRTMDNLIQQVIESSSVPTVVTVVKKKDAIVA